MADLQPMDRSIWLAFAGNTVKIPAVGSLVLYFPEGHAEQSSTPLDFSRITIRKPYVLAILSSVSLHADPESDEVFARMRLDPPDSDCGSRDGGQPEVEEGAVSFLKVLTPSDANNGGGFSVPKFCATSVFPQLNFSEDMPVQTLTARDPQGNRFEFRHVYRGAPRRHLLTTGWSKFVNQKNLISGDSIIFARDGSGQIHVGIRRSIKERAVVPDDALAANPRGFWRCGRGRVPAESVMEAMRMADMGMPFEVVYYPRAGLPNFVVEAATVDRGLKMNWTPGTTITWDDEDGLQHLEHASPWQVVIPGGTPQQIGKRPRNAISNEISHNGESSNMVVETNRNNNGGVGTSSPSLESPGTIPDSPQGFCRPGLPNSGPSHMCPVELAGEDESCIDKRGKKHASSPQQPEKAGAGKFRLFGQDIEVGCTRDSDDDEGSKTIQLFPAAKTQEEQSKK
ncbi:hypothetical protein J5N97_012365 [Dioscorea zingiberensis]|uniref:TF-B3 domain-containing protein n=1 Tax=Dioscorea zingiberensis TaxID=325984 RepID=A0A9D5HHM7_9LILI|nr:hypothetical protein J5N97_012365 [Dioscorea zingiberensis]